ncbi:MAG: hypothetical protein HZB91_04690 [Elusimicrobia bacterium]|nr:hypothetical protein [Elusimicrobiota bacterium]
MVIPVKDQKPQGLLSAAAAAAGLLAFAAAYNAFWGLRSINSYMAAPVIDAGYRVFLGQTPLADFFSPYALVLAWLQGLFFKWFGASYAAYLTLGCAMNAAAAGLVFWSVWSEERDVGLAAAGGLVTAAWLMPISGGGPVHNSGAFFFVLAAAVCLWTPSRGLSPWRTLLAGAALAMAFLTKQNVGAFAAFFLALYVLAAGSPADLGRLGAGIGLGLAVLALAIGPSAWGDAWHFVVALPAGERLWGRFLGSKPAGWLALAGLGLAVLLRKGERPLLACAAILFLAHLLGGQDFRPGVSVHMFLPLAALPLMVRREDRAMLLALVLVGYSSAVSASAAMEHSMPLVGVEAVLVCLAWKRGRSDPAGQGLVRALAGNGFLAGDAPVWAGMGLLILLGVRQAAMHRWGVLASVPVVGPLVGLAIAWAGWRLWRGRGSCEEPGRARVGGVGLALVLVGAGWAGRQCLSALGSRGAGQSVPLGEGEARDLRIPFFQGLDMPQAEARGIAKPLDYLAGLPPESRPFFVYQSGTGSMLYAALGQAPPQPFVMFDRGFTHGGLGDYEKVCSALKAADIRAAGFDDSGEDLLNEPGLECLRRWLETDFFKDKESGGWVFYRRRPVRRE